MKPTVRPCRMILLLVALALTAACGGGSSDGPSPGPTPPPNTPPIPVPKSASDLLPDRSSEIEIGLSDPLQQFDPHVVDYEIMLHSGLTQWETADQTRPLACPNVLPEYSSNPTILQRGFIAARPRLLHKRYWQRIEDQVTIQPHSTFKDSRTWTSGREVSDQKSVQFSQTIGVDLQAGGTWDVFSAAVTASYENTLTVTEVRTVAFSTTTSITKEFTATPERPSVWALWQLVDKFSVVDQNGVPIDQSPTLSHVRIDPVPDIEFPATFVFQSLTEF